MKKRIAFTLSIINPRMRSSHLHFAQIINTSLQHEDLVHTVHQIIQTHTYATGALEIHVLLPLRMNPPSTSSAVVSIPAGSEP